MEVFHILFCFLRCAPRECAAGRVSGARQWSRAYQAVLFDV
jgi:hypothetical protein